jgi:predicted branched-subunit amino acid permease
MGQNGRSISPGDEIYEAKNPFFRGMRDAIPIGLGYFAVSFSLGIAAGNVGYTTFQGFLLSLLNVSSSGEYAGIVLSAEQAGFIELALMICVANARYLLMSFALSQRFSPSSTLFHRLTIGFGLTDELFGLGIASKGWLDPVYMYGAFFGSIPLWALGTAFGVYAGNVLPVILSEALNVAIFGMFLAIIIPPGRKDPVVLGAVIVSFLLSLLASVLPLTASISSGTRTLILTIIIASAVALLFPLKDEPAQEIRTETTEES